MALTTYTIGEVLTAASLNDNLAYAVTVPAAVPGGLVCVKAETAFSAVSSITADSIFTSSYTNYLIQITWTGGTGIGLKLRAAGVSASTNYSWLRIYAYGTTIGVSTSASTTSWTLNNNYSGVQASIPITLYSPQLAQVTSMDSMAVGGNGALTSPEADRYSGNHTTATAYDGFEITGTTITGFYSVYGYSKVV